MMAKYKIHLSQLLGSYGDHIVEECVDLRKFDVSYYLKNTTQLYYRRQLNFALLLRAVFLPEKSINKLTLIQQAFGEDVKGITHEEANRLLLEFKNWPIFYSGLERLKSAFREKTYRYEILGIDYLKRQKQYLMRIAKMEHIHLAERDQFQEENKDNKLIEFYDS